MVEWVPSTKDGTVLRVDPKSLEVETANLVNVTRLLCLT